MNWAYYRGAWDDRGFRGLRDVIEAWWRCRRQGHAIVTEPDGRAGDISTYCSRCYKDIEDIR